MATEMKTLQPGGLSAEEKADFQTEGFLHIRGAISSDKAAHLSRMIDTHTADEPDSIQNRTDVFSIDPAFLNLVDLPQILPKVRDILGDNIWINHTHFNRNPALPPEEDWSYFWHRDGGAVVDDLPFPAPLVFIKVGFYLTDLSEADSGQTHVIPGSHRRPEAPPAPHEFPAGAVPIKTQPGDAILYDYRVIHSLQSPNSSPTIRRAVFLQYAYRWIQPLSSFSILPYMENCSPIRRQLLGLTRTESNLAGRAKGRSGLFYPTKEDVPLRGASPKKTGLKKLIWQAMQTLRS
ncbi:MAG: hypothetical protein CMJ81_23075 [Planctomycetaceae bacterium]|nr:hypothetical protein [Planctomycetaceae bacterium]MBP60218.1 hypothetical protein [Planctomycetaceae bacterium]